MVWKICQRLCIMVLVSAEVDTVVIIIPFSIEIMCFHFSYATKMIFMVFKANLRCWLKFIDCFEWKSWEVQLSEGCELSCALLWYSSYPLCRGFILQLSRRRVVIFCSDCCPHLYLIIFNFL